MLNDEIFEYMEANNTFYKGQSGFKKCRQAIMLFVLQLPTGITDTFAKFVVPKMGVH